MFSEGDKQVIKATGTRMAPITSAAVLEAGQQGSALNNETKLF